MPVSQGSTVMSTSTTIRRKRCETSSDAPVAQLEQSGSLLRRRPEVRVLPGALAGHATNVATPPRTDSSTAEPPAFNREVAGSNPARCIDRKCDGSVAQSGKRRLAQNEEVVGSNPTRTTEKTWNWFV